MVRSDVLFPSLIGVREPHAPEAREALVQARWASWSRPRRAAVHRVRELDLRPRSTAMETAVNTAALFAPVF